MRLEAHLDLRSDFAAESFEETLEASTLSMDIGLLD